MASMPQMTALGCLIVVAAGAQGAARSLRSAGAPDATRALASMCSPNISVDAVCQAAHPDSPGCAAVHHGTGGDCWGCTCGSLDAGMFFNAVRSLYSTPGLQCCAANLCDGVGCTPCFSWFTEMCPVGIATTTATTTTATTASATTTTATATTTASTTTTATATTETATSTVTTTQDNLEYCPQADELNVDFQGGVLSLENQGWTSQGVNRASTKGVFNVLGGSIQFTMDLSGTIPGNQSGPMQGPNANLYIVFPQRGEGDYLGTPVESDEFDVSQYCDGNPIEFTNFSLCAELDIIEANSRLAWATTWHTNFVDDPLAFDPIDPCNQFGCENTSFFDSDLDACADPPPQASIDTRLPFQVRADFAADGAMTVTFSQPGNAPVVIRPEDVSGGGRPVTQRTLDVIRGNMTEHGVVIESSQFNGFVPANSQFTRFRCPNGCEPNSTFNQDNVGPDCSEDTLADSVYRVSDLKITGRKIRGSASLCRDL